MMRFVYSPLGTAAPIRIVLLLVWLALPETVRADSAAANQREATVGLSARIDQLILPGSELEAVPHADRAAPIVLRIVDSFPHGADRRYDLEYYGLEPGEFDLRDYLRRKDGSATSDLPSLAVTIHSVLPAGQIQPHGLTIGRSRFFFLYRWQLALLAALWCVGLVWLLAGGWARRRATASAAAPVKSVADRLRDYLDQAIRGEPLASGQQAELERLLVTFWRERLGLVQGTSAAEAMRVLRAHPEAGEVLRQVEAWLHRPPTTGQDRSQVMDFERLLAPYRRAETSASGGTA